MDPENTGKETIIKVTTWLRGIWEMRRRTGPVQQWVDSIPSPTKTNLPLSNAQEEEEVAEKPNVSTTPTEPKDIPISMGTKPPSMTVSAPISVPNSPAINAPGIPSSVPYNRLARDPSLQSDSSHCSSVESLLELRRVDPEAILLGLGFGGCSSSPQDNGPLSRIPKRFLQPSKLKGIAINDFVKHQQETSESFDSVSLGYRGLTGSPYVAPSEIVQKIMERLREHESHEVDPYAPYNCYEQYSPLQQNGTFSVLSPDNRQFLERPRSKSPDMRNKRMIIGQKSFAFGCDGDLIEIDPSDTKTPPKNNLNSKQNRVEINDVTRNCKVVSKEYVRTIEKISVQKVEKKLPKQLSFDDSTEAVLNDITGDSLVTHNDHEDIEIKNAGLVCEVNYKKDLITNTTCKAENITKYSPETRRASDGSYEVAFLESIPISEGRRHSDSIVHTIENCNNESLLLQRRKTLRRQSRISDVDAIDYCNSHAFPVNVSEGEHPESNLLHEVSAHEQDTVHPLRQRELLQSVTENAQLNSKSECCGAKFSDPLSEGTHDCVQAVDDVPCRKTWLHAIDKPCTKENQVCCYEEKGGQACRHGDDCVNCCCRSGTTKYWKKMEKIIQENKKLESMVAKSTREMAEIREMLNNVLSVRMEPGF